jgi:phosphoglycerate kinase
LKKTISEVDPRALAGKTAVVRVDFNVPLEGRVVTDDRRIAESVPTIDLLRKAGARVVLLSHLGRPDGEAKDEFSLAPVAARLQELLKAPVTFVRAPGGADVQSAVRALPAGGVALLENTRFLPGDEDNDRDLAAFWASLGDLFVNDAFGVAHRAHASTSGLAEAMAAKGGQSVAGLLMARELRFLEEALHAPERPFTAILG